MIGALVAGAIADVLGFQSSIQVVAALIAASGILAAVTLSKQKVKVAA
jgi:hypothetical protein